MFVIMGQNKIILSPPKTSVPRWFSMSVVKSKPLNEVYKTLLVQKSLSKVSSVILYRLCAHNLPKIQVKKHQDTKTLIPASYVILLDQTFFRMYSKIERQA